MLKKRVIIVLQLNNGVLFRTKNFVPDYRYTQSFLGAENCDEVVMLDITRPADYSRAPFGDAMQPYVEKCYVPVTAGGHVSGLDHFAYLLRECGADKIVINTAAYERPKLITEAADKHGRQAVVVGIDANADHQVVIGHGVRATYMPVEIWAAKAVELGAGEIFVTSIERDGSLRGYDLPLLEKVLRVVKVPVVIAGGCGNWQHMADAFAAGADGAASSNIFHLTDTAMYAAKKYLAAKGIAVRPAA